MPPTGWPPAGSPFAEDLRCMRHLRASWRWHGLASDVGSGLAAAAGVMLVLAGFVMVAILGRNYGPCQSTVTATLSPAACNSASVIHWGGITGLVAGGAVILATMVSAARR
jgi:hypothetical protein